MSETRRDKLHDEILELFRKSPESKRSKQGNEYIGSSKLLYSVDSPTTQKLIKEWIKSTSPLSFTEYKHLLDSLAQGRSHNEFQTIGRLLRFFPIFRRELPPAMLERWLSRAEGWAEVDGICQSNFTAEELLSCWQEWESVLINFSLSQNIHVRRASLVLLTGPVRHSNDKRLSELAFQIIEELKGEKGILITKAISWLLRDLIKFHREEVEEYVQANDSTLPRIAVRETLNKLKSGRKSGK